jgi:hypothetical protein
VTFATLLRSVALDRWITVAASILLLLAAHAAQRGRTWGVGLSFALGVTFAGLWALGIAPIWFAIVGVLAARPFVSLFRHFSRFDRGAAALLAVLAAGLGGLAAVAWQHYALALFRAFPFLTPSAYPHHGLAVLAMIAGAFAVRKLSSEADPERAADDRHVEGDASVIEHARVRVSTDEADGLEEADALAELESELDPHQPRRNPYFSTSRRS